MIINMGYSKRVAKRILFFILSIIALCLTIKLSIFYLPFLIAFIISAIIEPLVKWVKKITKLQRKTSAILVLIIVSAIIVGLIGWGITALIAESYNLLQGLNGYTEKVYNYIQSLIEKIDFNKYKLPEQILKTLQNSSQDLIGVVSNWIRSFLNSLLQIATSLPQIGVYVVITLLATYFVCVDRFYLLDQIEHHLPRKWVKKITIHVKDIISSLGDYLKAEIILIIIAFVQVLIGLLILKYLGMNIQYPLLAAIGIGFVDALPILGSGSVIIPWAVISAINGDIKLAIRFTHYSCYCFCCKTICRTKTS